MTEKIASLIALAWSLGAMAIQLLFPGGSYLPGLVAIIGAGAAFALSTTSSKVRLMPVIAIAISCSVLVGNFFVRYVAPWEQSLLAKSSYVTAADVALFVSTFALNKGHQKMTPQSGAILKLKSHLKKIDENEFNIILGAAEIPQKDRYLHTLIVGTTGTGKSSRLLKPMIYQDLEIIAAGKKAGITVIEPKGDLAADVAEMAKSFGVPVIFVNPEDPDTPKFNPMEGDPTTVAEITRTVLQALFGRQEAFFRQAQETVAKNTVMLLKSARGDNVTMQDLAMILQDQTIMRATVDELVRRTKGPTALTQFFNKELLNEKSDLHKHILGLRLQLEDITSNELLNRVLNGKSDVNLDDHLRNGGVLVFNTAMGRLGKLGDVFGKFAILHYQSAVFRRPGDENTRVPNFLYIDEAPRYMNPDFEILLAIGRSFRCAATVALQNTSQLLLDAKPAFRDIVLELLRNKFILNLGSADDAKRFALEFGEDRITKSARIYKRTGPVVIPIIEDSIRQDEEYEGRLNYTDLMELPAFTCAYKVCHNGAPQPPGITRLELSPYDKQKGRRKNESEFSVRKNKVTMAELKDRDIKAKGASKTPLDHNLKKNLPERIYVPQPIMAQIPEYSVTRISEDLLPAGEIQEDVPSRDPGTEEDFFGNHFR